MEVKQLSGVRYAHTSIVARDWKRLAAFYAQVFQCQPAGPERHNHGPQVEALTGIPGASVRGQHLRLPGHGVDGPTLEIFQYEQPAEGPKPLINRPGLAHLAFQVDDVAATREEILARGGAGYGELQTIQIPGAGTLTLVYMTDPEGNIIELQRWG
jgi:predicted enzyme related to lactoylglutathione lyase